MTGGGGAGLGGGGGSTMTLGLRSLENSILCTESMYSAGATGGTGAGEGGASWVRPCPSLWSTASSCASAACRRTRNCHSSAPANASRAKFNNNTFLFTASLLCTSSQDRLLTRAVQKPLPNRDRKG